MKFNKKSYNVENKSNFFVEYSPSFGKVYLISFLLKESLDVIFNSLFYYNNLYKLPSNFLLNLFKNNKSNVKSDTLIEEPYPESIYESIGIANCFTPQELINLISAIYEESDKRKHIIEILEEISKDY